MTQLRSVTCHMGSHSVTYYPTQANTRKDESYTSRSNTTSAPLNNCSYLLGSVLGLGR